MCLYETAALVANSRYFLILAYDDGEEHLGATPGSLKVLRLAPHPRMYDGSCCMVRKTKLHSNGTEIIFTFSSRHAFYVMILERFQMRNSRLLAQHHLDSCYVGRCAAGT